MPKLLAVLIMSLVAWLSSAKEVDIPFDCHAIPSSQESLCLLVTDSRYGPYDDVAFYKMDANQRLTFIQSQDGHVATFFFSGFSPKGKYMVMAWAEEGHPSFIIHDTQKFINQDSGPSAVGYVSDYYIHGIEYIGDDGVVILNRAKDDDEPRPYCLTESTVVDVSDTDYCYLQTSLSQLSKE